MRFSVVIPSYNKANSIGRAIESVLNQTFQDFEIIVVENNSTDNSLEVIKSFDSDKIVLIHERQQGVSFARNTGWRTASGNYICFLDADDTYEPRNLYELDILIKKFPKAGIYANRYKIVDIRGQAKEVSIQQDWLLGNCYIHNNFFEAFVIGQMPVNTNTVCIARNVLSKSLGFDPRLTTGEDIDLWARLFADRQVIIGDYVGSVYWHNTANRSIKKLHLDSYRLLISKFDDLFFYHPSLKKYEMVFSQFIAYIMFGVGLSCLLAGEKGQAKEWLQNKRLKVLPNQNKLRLLKIMAYLPNFFNQMLFSMFRRLKLLNI
jgi:glycosyltransferase involved in cell wall biosynthesis